MLHSLKHGSHQGVLWKDVHSFFKCKKVNEEKLKRMHQGTMDSKELRLDEDSLDVELFNVSGSEFLLQSHSLTISH